MRKAFPWNIRVLKIWEVFLRNLLKHKEEYVKIVDAILRVVRMNVTKNEKSLDALARKMTITRSLKLKLILEKEDPFQLKLCF